MNHESSRSEDGAFAAGVILATILGMALRAYHLSIPVRYDEAVTFLSYASGDFVHAVTAYPTPNNHLFHTLLVWTTNTLFGPFPFFVRAPAFIAGCLMVPATAWMAARLWDRRVGVVSAFLVAATPVLVQYATNARGYSIVGLVTVASIAVGARLLDDPRPAGWLALAVLGVTGLYTVPVMLLPWAGITVWLFVNLFVGAGGLRDRLRRELPLVATLLLVTALTVALYVPVVRANGLEALTGNRFVAPLGWGELAGAAWSSAIEVAAHWTRGVPWPLAVLAALGLVAALVLRPGDRARFPLSWSLVIGVAAVMAVQRNPGEARVWLWALPVVIATAASGLTALVDRTVRRSLAPAVVAAAGGAVSAVLAIHMVVDRPLWRSLETGAFMEAEQVSAWLAPRVEPDDVLVTDFVSREPLVYYLTLYGVPPDALVGEPGPEGRAWVVMNRNEAERAGRTAARAAALGIDLDRARPMATWDRVELFGFGQDRGNRAPEAPADSTSLLGGGPG